MTAAVLLWISSQFSNAQFKGSSAEESVVEPCCGLRAGPLGEDFMLTSDVASCSKSLLVCHFS